MHQALKRPSDERLVPFAVTAALVRGMTIAPRVQVFTQLSCASIYQDYNLPHSHTHDSPLAPASYPRYNLTDVGAPVEEDGGYILIPSSATPLGWLSSAQPAPDRCHADPAVQSRAARLQTTFMIITVSRSCPRIVLHNELRTRVSPLPSPTAGGATLARNTEGCVCSRSARSDC